MNDIEPFDFEKSLSHLSSDEKTILRYHLRRRNAQTCPEPRPFIWFLMGGRGCVAAGTPIYDPTQKKSIPVEDRNAPGWVLALTPEGPRPALASASFLKGQAELFEVRTATGDVVQVTAEHRFLTPMGWLTLQEIGVGDLIASLDQSMLPANDQHLKDTNQGSGNDYHQPYHSDDQQPQLIQGIFQSQPLQPTDVLEHTLPLSQKGVQELLQGCIHPYPQYDLHSKTHSGQSGLWQGVVSGHAQSSSHELLPLVSPALPQSPELIVRLDQIQGHPCALPVTGVDDGSQFFDFESELLPQSIDVSMWTQAFLQSGTPPLGLTPTHIVDDYLQEGVSDSLECLLAFNSSFVYSDQDISIGKVKLLSGNLLSTWNEIVSIRSVGVADYYDLTVPEYENYMAAGMFHHNSGKTWTAANWIFEYARQLALQLPKTPEHDVIRVALIGQSFSDVQKTMCEGQSGLLSIIPKELQIKWNRSSTELWVQIPSAERTIYFAGFTSQVPEKLRGPQFHIAWIDEPAKLEDANAEPMGRDTTWSNLMFGIRLGKEVNAPHIIVSGTPTDCKLVQYLSTHDQSHMTHMTTLDNRDNLPDTTIREILALNPNSRTYRQEVLAEILLDNPDALFEQSSIDENRSKPPTTEELIDEGRPPLRKILGWDPSVSTSEDGDEAGIILTGYTEEVKIKTRAGLRRGGKPRITKDMEAYVLKDLSGHLSPLEQAELVIDTMLENKIQDLVFERNQGADQILTILTQVLKEKTADFTIRKLPGKTVNLYGSVDRYQVVCHLFDGTIYRFTANSIHAQKNKKVRAETASIKYDQCKVHHPPVDQPLPVCSQEACKQSLEIQMTSWNPNVSSHRYNSPDRMDALVYTLLLIFGSGTTKDKKNLINSPTATSYSTGLRPDQQISKTPARRKGPTGIYSRDVINTGATGGLLEGGRMSPEDMNRLW